MMFTLVIGTVLNGENINTAFYAGLNWSESYNQQLQQSTKRLILAHYWHTNTMGSNCLRISRRLGRKSFKIRGTINTCHGRNNKQMIKIETIRLVGECQIVRNIMITRGIKIPGRCWSL